MYLNCPGGFYNYWANGRVFTAPHHWPSIITTIISYNNKTEAIVFLHKTNTSPLHFIVLCLEHTHAGVIPANKLVKRQIREEVGRNDIYKIRGLNHNPRTHTVIHIPFHIIYLIVFSIVAFAYPKQVFFPVIIYVLYFCVSQFCRTQSPMNL